MTPNGVQMSSSAQNRLAFLYGGEKFSSAQSGTSYEAINKKNESVIT